MVRPQAGLEISSVDFEQLGVLVMLAATHHLALVREGRVGEEGRETAAGLLALKVGQQRVSVWLWKQREYKIV